MVCSLDRKCGKCWGPLDSPREPLPEPGSVSTDFCPGVLDSGQAFIPTSGFLFSLGLCVPPGVLFTILWLRLTLPKHWSSALGFSLAQQGSQFLTHPQPRLFPQDFVSGTICLCHLKWDLHPTPDSLICFPSMPVPSRELKRRWREQALLHRPG